MRRQGLTALTVLGFFMLVLSLFSTAAMAAPGPAWTITDTAEPANFTTGVVGEYVVVATNVGAAPTAGSEPEAVLDVPAGMKILTFSAQNSTPGASDPGCVQSAQEVICKTAEPFGPGRLFIVEAQVEVLPSTPEGTLEGKASVSGGGGGQASATAPTVIGPNPLPFELLPGFRAPLSEEDGTPATQAGSHPYQQTFSFGFPTKDLGSALTNDGHPKNVSVELPRGLVGSPAATPLCTEAELTGEEGCPEDTQVGVIDVTSLVGEKGLNSVLTSTLYNMVPPPGAVAELATDVGTVGIFLHSLIGVRTDGDYGVEATTHDAIAFGQQPIFNVQAQVWGDPGAKAHDTIRGKCRDGGGECPVTDSGVPLLTLPGECPGKPLIFKVRTDTWEEPNPPFPDHETSYESADLAGNPVSITGCEAMRFEPTISVRPSTTLTDSPAGLDVSVHQPQETKFEDPHPPATLKDAVIRFPAGLAVNPAQASGLGACSEAQIGFNGKEGSALRFSKAPQSCPDAAKIGTLEVSSPALVVRNAKHEVEKDPEGNPVLEALHGSIYIAQPFQNPFESLIGVYLVVEDEKTGIVSKLAGKGELDPTTGQITTRFTESPELPLEDIKAHIFGGPRGAFITPPTCGPFTTTTELVPWSAPQGKSASPQSSFQTTQAPGGGACPTAASQLPNAPRFSAGSLSPGAGQYSPLLFKLSREDGSQRFGRIETRLPSGLSARLAGVGICSEADIAKARSREQPQMGALEQADPSCPASSEVGTISASAGAGPTPFRTTGHVYLAGPYEGAPISFVTIAPAVAGPFDLGTVVVRIAVYLDPSTAQGRAVSDPLPSILHGVPIDLRQVSVSIDRPSFALNPTSCDEKSFGGAETSTLGQAAPLFERFQVGGCSALPYGPKLTANLFGPTHRGAHPALKSVFTATEGEANTADISLTLPRSEFIDQAHFRTICTRVQFAANQCPPGSIYGHVQAYSPLLGYPLEGPVYLRSSSHELPDTVLALHGPAYQPLFFEADGQVDSLHGGLRVRFESLPDAPLSRVIVKMQGAKKGLFQNSTNICKGAHRATLLLTAQNGKVHDTRPPLKAQCKKGRKGAKGKGKKGGAKARH